VLKGCARRGPAASPRSRNDHHAAHLPPLVRTSRHFRERIDAAPKSGVAVNACQNTMRGMKLVPTDMLPAIGYVPSGVVEVMRQQQQGWACIRS